MNDEANDTRIVEQGGIVMESSETEFDGRDNNAHNDNDNNDNNHESDNDDGNDDGNQGNNDMPVLDEDPNDDNNASNLATDSNPRTPSRWLTTYSSPTCLNTLADINFDPSAASALLEHTLSKTTDLGIFGILNHPQLSISLGAGCLDERYDADPHSAQELVFAMLAMTIELDPTTLPPHLRPNKDMLVDTLRIEFLKLIPTLTWKSADLRLSQCAALVLASYTWSLKQGLVEIAGRWNDLARLIWDEIKQSKRVISSSPLVSSIGNAIQLQNAVLGLLHLSGATLPIDLNSVTTASQENHSHNPHMRGSVASTADNSGDGNYFALFLPLLKPLQEVSKLTRQPVAMSRVRDSLELFYLEFPPTLLEFASLAHPYQAESMVWVHGIFILTFVRQDLLDILIDKSITLYPEFYSAVEHALLLSEVLPTLMALDPGGQRLCPATVVFILISSSITAAALWLFHCPVDSDEPMTMIGDVPDALVITATSLLQFLEAVMCTESRYDVKLIRAVYDILSSLSTGLNYESYHTLHSALYELAHYRWHEDGSGVRRLPEGPMDGIVQIWPARAEGPSPFLMQLPPVARVEDMMMTIDTIKSIASPEARICRKGCFDLSIQF